MALTTDVKAELVSIRNAPPTVRVAEVTAILRFAGGLHSIAGRVAVEAEVDAETLARAASHVTSAEIYGVASRDRAGAVEHRERRCPVGRSGDRPGRDARPSDGPSRPAAASRARAPEPPHDRFSGRGRRPVARSVPRRRHPERAGPFGHARGSSARRRKRRWPSSVPRTGSAWPPRLARSAACRVSSCEGESASAPSSTRWARRRPPSRGKNSVSAARSVPGSTAS